MSEIAMLIAFGGGGWLYFRVQDWRARRRLIGQLERGEFTLLSPDTITTLLRDPRQIMWMDGEEEA